MQNPIKAIHPSCQQGTMQAVSSSPMESAWAEPTETSLTVTLYCIVTIFTHSCTPYNPTTMSYFSRISTISSCPCYLKRDITNHVATMFAWHEPNWTLIECRGDGYLHVSTNRDLWTAIKIAWLKISPEEILNIISTYPMFLAQHFFFFKY